MGVFKHEAAVIDPVGKHAFLTEDLGDGCFYRFRPDSYPDLSSGRLDVAVVDEDGKVTWAELPDPQFTGAVPTRQQVPGATTFRRGEGAWYDEGMVYFATTQDDRVYAYNCAAEELEVLYDGVALGEAAPLHDTDNVTVSPVSGDLFVCEDADDLQVCLISTEGEAAAFLQLPGPEHANSELTGPVFDPTGRRFYVASQRAAGGGVIFEIKGPFRRTRPEPFPDKAGPKVRVRVLGKPSLRGLLASGQAFRFDGFRRQPAGRARHQAGHPAQACRRQGFAPGHDRPRKGARWAGRPSAGSGSGRRASSASGCASAMSHRRGWSSSPPTARATARKTSSRSASADRFRP